MRVTWPEALRRCAKANSAVWEDGPRPALPSGCSLGLLLVCKLVFLTLALPVASMCFCAASGPSLSSLTQWCCHLPREEVTCGNFGFTCPSALPPGKDARGHPTQQRPWEPDLHQEMNVPEGHKRVTRTDALGTRCCLLPTTRRVYFDVRSLHACKTEVITCAWRACLCVCTGGVLGCVQWCWCKCVQGLSALLPTSRLFPLAHLDESGLSERMTRNMRRL